MVFLKLLEDHVMNMPLTRPIPLLKEGDRLTREEFELRYDAMPDLNRAELIEGVVYMGSPVRYDQHGQQHADAVTWLGLYRIFTPGIGVGDNTSVRLDLENEPQPDGVMFIEIGGQVYVEDGYVNNGPELAVEVAASSVGLDLGVKFQVYRRNGVREYIVWRVLDRDIDWFVLRGDQYERLAADDAGILRSEVFPGLWLDKAALLNGDLPRVHEVLQQGLHSAEHQGFAADLKQRAAQGKK
jgi:Putative restriction endonuclease